jgi:hypothetical protein
MKRVFRVSLQLASEAFFILRRTEWDMIDNVYLSSCKYPLFLSDFNETGIPDRLSKSTQVLNFMKIGPVGAQLFHEDGRTWRS